MVCRVSSLWCPFSWEPEIRILFHFRRHWPCQSLNLDDLRSLPLSLSLLSLFLYFFQSLILCHLFSLSSFLSSHNINKLLWNSCSLKSGLEWGLKCKQQHLWWRSILLPWLKTGEDSMQAMRGRIRETLRTETAWSVVGSPHLKQQFSTLFFHRYLDLVSWITESINYFDTCTTYSQCLVN